MDKREAGTPFLGRSSAAARFEATEYRQVRTKMFSCWRLAGGTAISQSQYTDHVLVSTFPSHRAMCSLVDSDVACILAGPEQLRHA